MRLIRTVVLTVTDIFLIALATICALGLRENLVVDSQKFVDLLLYLAITIAVAVFINILLGLDRSLWRYTTMPDYFRVVVAIVLTVLTATLITFMLNRLEGVSRSIPILQAVLAVVFLVGARIAVRLICNSRAKTRSLLSVPAVHSEHGRQTVLIVGLTTLTVLYLRSVAELASDRIRIGGIVAHGEHHAGKLLRHHQIFGPETDLSVLLRDLAVHGVFVDRILVTLSVDQLASGLQAQLRGIQADSMIRVEHLPEQLGLYSRVSHEAASESSLGGGLNGGPIMNDQVSVFDIEALGKSAERSYWKAKRLIDVVLAGFFLILFAPLLLVVSGLVALAVGLPTIFWQDRPGMAGRPFRLYKFRTMGPAFDSRGAPVPEARRLNVIGHFLRATRLDELPQLWNILIGDMSFVGPRPLLNVDQPVELAARLLVRPGLTGWAQVSAGRQVSASDKAALDVWYVRNASLMLDLEIFARTVPIVLFRERRCTAAIERAWADLKNSGLCSPVLTEGLASKQDATVYASVPREKIRASAG